MTDKLIKVSTVAAQLGFHPESIYRQIRLGTLPIGTVVYLGRSIRLRERLINEWVEKIGKTSRQPAEIQQEG